MKIPRSRRTFGPLGSLGLSMRFVILLAMKLLRLRGRKVCERLLRQGKVWKGKNLNIRWTTGYPRHPASLPEVPAIYVGTLASTKLEKSAVKRNRMRRRCREALRLLAPDVSIPVSVQLLIAPRSSSLKAPFPDLQADIRAFFSTVSHGRSPEAK